MKVIHARNVNDAYERGVEMLRDFGQPEQSRAGQVLVMPCPVTTVYERPQERILWNGKRNANPFFHLGEALWMLAGRNDATWLDQFVGDFSSRFAEEGGLQHGAYGYRWRKHFTDSASPFVPDQLDAIVDLLHVNPSSRQIVLTMWDPAADLGAVKKDLCCNTHVYFRVRKEPTDPTTSDFVSNAYLDITVCCRSNDIIWGAYGANAVHFSVLQEYIAARAGFEAGSYYQVSNNYHAYLNTLPQNAAGGDDLYRNDDVVKPTKIVTSPAHFDQDLKHFFLNYSSDPKYPDDVPGHFDNDIFNVAWRLFRLYSHRRELTSDELRRYAGTASLRGMTDWDVAGILWLERFIQRRGAKHDRAE